MSPHDVAFATARVGVSLTLVFDVWSISCIQSKTFGISQREMSFKVIRKVTFLSLLRQNAGFFLAKLAGAPM
jgi:hypothetical protein